jgi:Flp pilus assembly protein TadG
MDTTPLPLLGGHTRGRGAGVVESVIAAPVLLLMLLLVIQVGIWAHAHHVAAAAAQTALAAARAEEGSAGTGTASGAAALGVNAGGALEEADLSVARGADTVTVTITGQAPSIVPIPGLSWDVEASATGPVEQFIPTGDGS